MRLLHMLHMIIHHNSTKWIRTYTELLSFVSVFVCCYAVTLKFNQDTKSGKKV